MYFHHMHINFFHPTYATVHPFYSTSRIFLRNIGSLTLSCTILKNDQKYFLILCMKVFNTVCNHLFSIKAFFPFKKTLSDTFMLIAVLPFTF